MVWRTSKQNNDFTFIFLILDTVFKIQPLKNLQTYDQLNEME